MSDHASSSPANQSGDQLLKEIIRQKADIQRHSNRKPELVRLTLEQYATIAAYLGVKIDGVPRPNRIMGIEVEIVS